MNLTNGYKIETGIEVLNLENDRSSNLSTSMLLARSGVPDSHRRIADSYMILKKIFGLPAVQGRLTIEEKKLLAKYDFNLLEYSTIKQINEELACLKKWNESREKSLQESSDKIIEIRAKELKNLIASKYISVTNEIYNGYKALERYFEEISKYSV
ncbi:MAG: hypothetical protein WC197_01470 [Candidatus Gastranaerophilaceae bacterium]|jgi:transposase-like protein